jgi:CubicO group peptidase (beta-lactamase class C family)
VTVAVVKDDSVVYLKGFGTREAGTSQPVDGNTVFAIGSSSKAFTAAAVGMLVDEGRVEWDDRVTEHLPQFQLSDPYITREFTVRDLLTHRSGLERGEFIWYATDRNRDEILRRVRHLEPSWGFRSRYGYQNIMYLAAGEIIPAVTEQSWDDLVRERIFALLGMTRSSTSTLALRDQPNVATPHAEIDGQVRPIA